MRDSQHTDLCVQLKVNDVVGKPIDRRPPDGIAVPLRIRAGDDELSFLSTVTTFGTAVDLTAAEVSVEAFLPADEHTAGAVREAQRTGSSSP